MHLTRHKLLLIVWAMCIVVAGIAVYRETGSLNYGIAMSASLLAVSLGVPLMRAMTEFSK